MKAMEKIDPVNIALPQGRVLENGTIAVDLPTLDCLEKFWGANQDKFPFACQGKEAGVKPAYMREYQWVFGATKASVIETVLRLGRSGIHAAWYNWKEQDPDSWEFFFADRRGYKQDRLEKGRWTDEDEEEWQSRTEDNYHGWWRFEGVPDSSSIDEWFGVGTSAEELSDPNMSVAEVTTRLCEQTFDEWRDVELWELETHTPESVKDTINYWLKEKAEGQDYYGRENENPTDKH